jgi:hypothetical protein
MIMALHTDLRLEHEIRVVDEIETERLPHLVVVGLPRELDRTAAVVRMPRDGIALPVRLARPAPALSDGQIEPTLPLGRRQDVRQMPRVVAHPTP